MKKKGFIYILTVIIITILSLIFYFTYSYITNAAVLNNNIYDSKVIKYRLESLVNLKISEENFNKELENFYKSNDESRILSTKNIFKDVDLFSLKMVRSSVRSDKDFNLIARIRYKKRYLDGVYKASFINKIYKKKEGVTNSRDFTIDELIVYKNKINNIKPVTNKKVIKLRGNFKIKPYKSHAKIYEKVIESFDGKENIIEKEVYTLEPGDILIQEDGELEFIGDLKTYLFYILSSNVTFNNNKIYGLMYLKNPNVFGDFKLEGYLIDIYDKTNIEKIRTDYSVLKPNYMNLPDFIKFNIENIKI